MRYYLAKVDDYGMLCVQVVFMDYSDESTAEEAVVQLAEGYPKYIYFYVEEPAPDFDADLCRLVMVASRETDDEGGSDWGQRFLARLHEQGYQVVKR